MNFECALLFQPFLDEITMSSCQSQPDDPLKDPDFLDNTAEASSSTDSNAAKTVTVSTYLRGKLNFLAPELARSSSGSESEARKLTSFSRDLYELGLLSQPLIVTRNKLEYEIVRDGKDRVKGLSQVDMQGT